MNEFVSVGRHRVNRAEVVTIAEKPAPMRFFFTIGGAAILIFALLEVIGRAINWYVAKNFPESITEDDLLNILTSSLQGWGIIVVFLIVLLPLAFSQIFYLILLITGALQYVGVENRLTNWAMTNVVTVHLRNGGKVKTGLMSPNDAKLVAKKVESSLIT